MRNGVILGKVAGKKPNFLTHSFLMYPFSTPKNIKKP